MKIRKWCQNLIKSDDNDLSFNSLESEEGNTLTDAEGDTTQETYRDGITVITATYKGDKYIARLLESMAKQELEAELFEHLIIINGEVDRTPRIIEEFQKEHPHLNIKVHYSEVANASNARNLGIKYAAYKYTTFVDDDDYISPNYLKEMYLNAAPNRIVIAGFMDVDEETGKINPSYFSHELKKNSKLVEDPYRKLVGALTISVCKLIPTHHLVETQFNTKLKSGIDVSFYSRLYSRNHYQFYVVNLSRGAIYYRVARKNSMSKRPLSYEFNVTQRLNVISDLNLAIKTARDLETRDFIKGKVRAQTKFINTYLKKHPENAPRICKDITELDLVYFPYNNMNQDLSTKLIISFNFPPYLTASGNTVAKRVNAQGDIVDVVCNEMHLGVDEKLDKLAEEYIDRKMVVKSASTFGSWNNIKVFCSQGLDKIDEALEFKDEYESIYSRSMYPASHFLAFQYKTKHPDVFWTAEFSDPALFDSNGRMRTSPIEDPEFMDFIRNMARQLHFPEPLNDNLFFLCEYLPFLYADKVVFTNVNQRAYMLEKFPLPGVKSVVEAKSSIEAQLVPDERFYHLDKSDYYLDENHVHLAYFGAFYESRNMNNLFFALYSLQDVYKDRCKIHFFTSDVKGLEDQLECVPINGNIIIRPYVGYFEFLNLSTKFDCLIVNDTVSQEGEINPYLPSKLSDYLGSGSDVWIMYEKGSAMSNYQVKYKSPMNSTAATTNTLEKIIKDHLLIKSDQQLSPTK